MGIPLQKDEQGFNDLMQPPFLNSNTQPTQDEGDAIDKSNILRGGQTRHARLQYPAGYSEGPDEGDLPKEAREGMTGQSL
ncbi:hypothetical protein BDW59DRAFT_89778 [Aspergillus cavernicola]|uniref:Uncharacterized protein n=1 Tax=Aspergillus cavernicola TaxID=176166 RepID=A0ABR4I8C9_9EURO